MFYVHPHAGRLGNVLDVCISLDGALAVTASDDASLGVWDMDDLEGGAHVASRMHALEGHGGSVLACVFVGATHHVISASAVSVLQGVRLAFSN